MLLHKISLFLLICILSFSFSCKKCNPPADDAVAATLHDYTGLDGCTWVIKTSDDVLEPMNLGEFDIQLSEGKKIWIKYHLVDDMASICMVGPIVKLEGVWER